jgi:ribonuclease P protein component
MRRELRLKRPSEFKKTFKEGERLLGSCFVLYARKTDSPHARLGVSISKAHFKLATQRNRLRRVAKEVFKKEISPYFASLDVVIASRHGGKEKGIAEAARALKALILKLNTNYASKTTHSGCKSLS